MSHPVLSPYVSHPPIAKVFDWLGRTFVYSALALIGVATILPDTVMHSHLEPGPIYLGLAVVLSISAVVALVGVLLNSFFTEALAIGFVFLGFTPYLVSAISDWRLDLETVVSLILSATILIRWNYLSSAIAQARQLKEFTDVGSSEAA